MGSVSTSLLLAVGIGSIEGSPGPPQCNDLFGGLCSAESVFGFVYLGVFGCDEKIALLKGFWDAKNCIF